MGGGDLNLKKSWHPATFANQERVWLLEKKVEEERKKVEELRREREEERAQESFLKELERAKGGVGKLSKRLDWMYAGGAPVGGTASAQAEDKEAYLLGKKRVDSFVEQGNTVEELSSQNVFARHQNALYGLQANTMRDTQNKIREDPLLMIKRKEQAMVQAVLSNPLKVKKMKEEILDKDQDKKKKKKKKEKSRHSSEDEGERVSGRYGHSRDSSRSRQSRPRSKSPARHHRTRSPISHHRSRSPRNHRSRSPARHHRSKSPRNHRSKSPIRHHRSRSPTRNHRSRSPRNHRCRSPYRDTKRRREDAHRKPTSPLPRNAHSSSSHPPSSTSKKLSEEERLEKLRKMQQDAVEMEKERMVTLSKIDTMEKEEEEKDREARLKRAQDQGGSDAFARDLHRQLVGGISVAEMVGRNRAYQQKEDQFL